MLLGRFWAEMTMMLIFSSVSSARKVVQLEHLLYSQSMGNGPSMSLDSKASERVNLDISEFARLELTDLSESEKFSRVADFYRKRLLSFLFLNLLTYFQKTNTAEGDGDHILFILNSSLFLGALNYCLIETIGRH